MEMMIAEGWENTEYPFSGEVNAVTPPKHDFPFYFVRIAAETNEASYQSKGGAEQYSGSPTSYPRFTVAMKYVAPDEWRVMIVAPGTPET